ncbi:MAG: hypothetical protein RI996_594 [Candidatus Parcubacteria bacterium]|jgi:hypothetical protein
MNNPIRPNLNTDTGYLQKVGMLIDNKRHFGEIKFEYLDSLIKKFYPDVAIYDLLENENPKEKIQEIVESIYTKINSEKISTEINDLLCKMWDYLAEGDTLKKSDLIFVFGGISKLAVEEAIRLKKEDYAPYILFSGKHASYVNGIEKTEAEQYRDMAIERGVDPSEILIETESVNTPENIMKSRDVLFERNYVPKSIIVVSLPYHMKRAALTMWAGFEWEPKIIRHPGLSAKFTRENYYTDIKGFSYVFYEYIKIYNARRMEHF